jgi:hypothetical protein
MLPRIYTYKITFEEIPHWYWGVHKEAKYNDGYMGSPVTHAWMWHFYTPKMQIIEIFPYSDRGWEQACSTEQRIILHDLNNEQCLNERAGSIKSLSTIRKAAKKGGDTIYKNKIGIHGRTAEQMTVDSRKANKRPGGLAVKDKKTGIFGRSKKQRRKDNQKAAASTNAQKWKSLIDGFTGSASGVAKHNRASGWDGAARVRIL